MGWRVTYGFVLPVQEADAAHFFLVTVHMHDGRDGPRVFVGIDDWQFILDLGQNAYHQPIARRVRACSCTLAKACMNTYDVDKRLPLRVLGMFGTGGDERDASRVLLT